MEIKVQYAKKWPDSGLIMTRRLRLQKALNWEIEYFPYLLYKDFSYKIL